MLVRVIQITARQARAEEKTREVSWKRNVRLMRKPEILEMSELFMRLTITSDVSWEAWFSVQDTQSGNDHIAIPEVYKSLACA